MVPANAHTKDFNYKQYLASRDWALLKNAVRERSRGHCERCLAGEYEQTHHITYERVGREDLDDLAGLCKACHEYLSGRSEHNPCNFIQYTPEKVDGQWIHRARYVNDTEIIYFECRGDECLMCIQFSRLMAGLE